MHEDHRPQVAACRPAQFWPPGRPPAPTPTGPTPARTSWPSCGSPSASASWRPQCSQSISAAAPAQWQQPTSWTETAGAEKEEQHAGTPLVSSQGANWGKRCSVCLLAQGTEQTCGNRSRLAPLPPLPLLPPRWVTLASTPPARRRSQPGGACGALGAPASATQRLCFCCIRQQESACAHPRVRPAPCRTSGMTPACITSRRKRFIATSVASSLPTTTCEAGRPCKPGLSTGGRPPAATRRRSTAAPRLQAPQPPPPHTATTG